MTLSIKEFCNKHSACPEGRRWALSCGATTMQELWQRDDLKHEWRMWIVKFGVLTKPELLRFACWSVRQIWPLLTDERSRKAIETVELFSDGKVTIAGVESAACAACAAQNKWLIENVEL